MSFNHFHQSVEDIIKSANPEQKIIWNYIFLNFSENCSITQFYFNGQLSASELAVATPRRWFLAYDFSDDVGSISAALNIINFYNEAGVLIRNISNGSVYWDTTAGVARSLLNTIREKNLLFSYAGATTPAAHRIKFIGFKIVY